MLPVAAGAVGMSYKRGCQGQTLLPDREGGCRLVGHPAPGNQPWRALSVLPACGRLPRRLDLRHVADTVVETSVSELVQAERASQGANHGPI